MKTQFLLFLFILSILFFGCNFQESPLEEPVSSFFMDADEASVGDTVYFHNFSQHGETYLWSFGDGEQSTAISPYHVYNSEGKYKITLEAKNSIGTDSSSKKIDILP